MKAVVVEGTVIPESSYRKAGIDNSIMMAEYYRIKKEVGHE